MTMASKAPRKIELRGTAREIGLGHGRQLHFEIKRQLAIYGAMFEHTSNLSWPAVHDAAEEFRSTIEHLTPEIYQEMLGIAEGADVDILDIVALNCRSEIALGRFTDGCTSISWKAKGPQGNSVTLAQNWDWTAQVKENLVMMSIEKPGKPKVWMITESGIVGKIGFNSRGVGTCLNAVRARPTISSKIPVHVALRLCLESVSVDTAIETLDAVGGVASSQHILCADSTQGVGMEVSPLGNVYLRENENGIVTHSNHFVENKFVEEPPWLNGSPIRLERIRALATKLVGEGISGDMVTGELLRERIFSDTFNAPQAICCQEDATSPLITRSSTLFNIVMSLKGEKSTAEVVWGKPGSGEEGPVLKMPWN